MKTPLLTDLYQLTMGYGYWKQGTAEKRAVFHLFYRKAPFDQNAVISAGIRPAIEYLTNLEFTNEECAYLKSLNGADGKALFAYEYIDYLQQMKWQLNVKAVTEGDLVFPHAPILQVEGPLIQVQLVETALLNMINFQTLVATKAALICEAAEGDDVLEFGLRRAQGPDGGVSAARAAYIGGAVATSNVLAGMQHDIPVKGTHAHSWVMSHQDELEAFEQYAEAMPNNAVLLVDTYDTIEGIKKSINVGKKLREKGHDLLGVRLDSGDLTDLSIKARKLLDDAGFPDTRIVASNDLDNHTIKELKSKGAKIDTWGIGTKLVTAYDQPALGGVYKLAAIENPEGDWDYKIKLSNDLIKVSNPGKLQVFRQRDEDGNIVKDILFNEMEEDVQKFHNSGFDDLLLKEVINDGKCVSQKVSIHRTRDLALSSWKKRPNKAEVLELSPALLELKKELVAQHSDEPEPVAE